MDDFRDTPDGPGPIGDANESSEIFGYLDRAGDRDVFSLQMIAGLSYRLYAQSDGFIQFLQSASIHVEGPDGDTLDPDASDPLYSRVDVTATETGRHFITVSATDRVSTGDYFLTVDYGIGSDDDDRIRGTSANDRVMGAEGDDLICGGAGDDSLWGDFHPWEEGPYSEDGGRDRIHGGAGNDYIGGGAAADFLAGGSGDDSYYEVTSEDVVREKRGQGDDWISFLGENETYVLPENVETLSVDGAGITAYGNGSDNEINGDYQGGRLYGRGGDDTLVGGQEADLLVGGAGADVLSGSLGADVFRFGPQSSLQGAADLIWEYYNNSFEGAGVAGGDRIDLSPIDADPAASGRQALAFAEGPGAGRVWLQDRGAETLVLADFDGAPGRDLVIRIADGGAVQAADYAAMDFIL